LTPFSSKISNTTTLPEAKGETNLAENKLKRVYEYKEEDQVAAENRISKEEC
jgi:hypothetical protein